MPETQDGEPCPSCGRPMTPGGFALACGRGGVSTRIPLPPYCGDPSCAKRRDQAAIDKAVASGLIDP